MSATAAALELRPSSTPVIIGSVFFHLLVFIVIPLLMHMAWKPKEQKRPATFQLVSIPQPRAAARAVAAPAPIEPVVVDQTPVPKTSRAKPIEKTSPKQTVAKPSQNEKVEEDLSELNDLLGGLSQPVSSVAFADNFPYSWYERNIMNKVERNWRPPLEDDKLSVLVAFTIYTAGNISPVAVRTSSGNTMIDNLAVRAVQMAAPFGKLPPAYTSDHLDIEYTLRPSRR